MRIETYIICWNREESIELTIKHYQRLGKVILYDNFSTDDTRFIADELGVEVNVFGREGILDDSEYLKVKNNVWKQSTADWVIVVDDDEILWHPNLIEELQFARDSGATIVQPQGVGIFSNQMPVYEWTELMDGVIDDNYSKLCVFDPKAIQEIGYVFGCHQARPKGRIRQVNKLFLLHYRAVGGVKRLIERHKLYEPRRQKSAINMKWNLGANYAEESSKKTEWFNDNLSKSSKLWYEKT